MKERGERREERGGRVHVMAQINIEILFAKAYQSCRKYASKQLNFLLYKNEVEEWNN